MEKRFFVSTIGCLEGELQTLEQAKAEAIMCVGELKQAMYLCEIVSICKKKEQPVEFVEFFSKEAK